MIDVIVKREDIKKEICFPKLMKNKKSGTIFLLLNQVDYDRASGVILGETCGTFMANWLLDDLEDFNEDVILRNRAEK